MNLKNKYSIGVIIFFSVFLLNIYSAQAKCVSLTVNLEQNSTNSGTGGQVTLLQDFLYSSGYLQTKSTGRFGAETLKAVKKFQSAKGISATGYVGALTRAKLNELTCSTVAQVIMPTQTTPVVIKVPPTIVTTSPSTGTLLRIGQKFNISWTDSGKNIVDVLLEDSTGLAVGYIAAGRYQTNSFTWDVGSASAYGTKDVLVAPGDYRIRVVDSARKDSVTSQTSGIFTITEAPLSILGKYPSSVNKDDNSSVVLYGHNFNKYSVVHVEGRWDLSVTPNYLSPDGNIMVFTFPTNVYPGDRGIYVQNNYDNATGTPSNTVTIGVN